MSQSFEIQFCVPPGYQHLVAELYYNQEHFGELNTENGQLELLLFACPSGKPWQIPLADAINSLQDAQAQFMARSAFFA